MKKNLKGNEFIKKERKIFYHCFLVKEITPNATRKIPNDNSLVLGARNDLALTELELEDSRVMSLELVQQGPGPEVPHTNPLVI